MTDSVLQFVFTQLAKFIVGIQPFLPVICLVLAWAITAMVILNIAAAVKQGAQNIRQMHRIPCAKCRYATRDYHLKCSVHPREAFSEEAISCLDFE